MNQPDARLLRTFLVVAQELSFTRAAARLHVVQQAVSAQIQALESQMGVRLFDRTTRKVELTAAGVILRDRAAEAVLALDDAVREAKAAGRVAPTHLKCGHTTSAGWFLLPAAVGALEESAPELLLDSAERTPADLLHALRSGVIDVGVGLELHSAGPDLATREVRREPWMLAISSASPLIGAAAVDLADFANADWINWPKDSHPGYWDAVQRVFSEAGIAPHIRPARIGIADYIRAIGNGAVGIAPAASISHPLPGVALVPIAPEPQPARYSLVWNVLSPPAGLEHLLKAFTSAGLSAAR